MRGGDKAASIVTILQPLRNKCEQLQQFSTELGFSVVCAAQGGAGDPFSISPGSRRPGHPFALARALPAIFLRRRRAPSVLPWIRVSFLRGMARRFFFFCFSTLRAERMAMSGF